MDEVSDIEYDKIAQCLDKLNWLKQLNDESQEWRQSFVIFKYGQKLLRSNGHSPAGIWMCTSRIGDIVQACEIFFLFFQRMTNAFKLSISWDIERLTWIGYYNYEHNHQNIVNDNYNINHDHLIWSFTQRYGSENHIVSQIQNTTLSTIT